MSKALNILLNSFESVQNASSKAIDTHSISVARNEMASVNAVIREMEEGLINLQNKQEGFNQKIKEGTSFYDGLSKKIKTAVAAFASIKTVAAVVNLSDQMTSNEARLSMIVDDGGSVEELKQKIYESAQSSRASYTDTIETVAKLGLVAGDAFNNNDEMIKFSELVSKNLVVGGAGATEQASAMYQLTQAMSSGRLQGDEYRSIIENAPLLAKSIEDYMQNVKGATGSMKEWASEGLLTADVIKAAVFKSAGDVEEKFEDMPMTWAQVWTKMQNTAVNALDPLLKKINDLANNKNIEKAISGIISALGKVVIVASSVLTVISAIFNFFVDNWSWIGPIIWGIAAAMLFYWIVTKGVAMAQKVAKGITTAYTAAQTFLSIGFGVLKGSTAAASAAQFTYNSALLACPLTWIILLIIAVIAIIYAVIGAINKVKGTTISATGVIAGTILSVVAVIWNTIVGVINAIIQFLWSMFVEPFIGIIEWVLNVCNGGFDSFGGAVANLIGQIISWFLSLGKVVTKIIDAIFGTDWTGQLDSLQDKVLSWGKNDNAITISRDAPTLDDVGVSRWKYEDAYNTGYGWGKKLGDSMSNAVDTGLDKSEQVSGLLGNTEEIAQSSADSASALSATEEDLKYLRDIAEREIIDRTVFTELNLSVNNDMKVSSEMDLDGAANYFTRKLQEAIDGGTEAAYA